MYLHTSSRSWLILFSLVYCFRFPCSCSLASWTCSASRQLTELWETCGSARACAACHGLGTWSCSRFAGCFVLTWCLETASAEIWLSTPLEVPSSLNTEPCLSSTPKPSVCCLESLSLSYFDPLSAAILQGTYQERSCFLLSALCTFGSKRKDCWGLEST